MSECRIPSPAAASGRSSKYVLVAGSDANNLVYTTLLLQQLGYPVCSVASAEEALEMAGVAVPSLLITDLKIGGMTAPQLISVLRQKPSTASVPVIIKTELFSQTVADRCREAGAASCIRKPVTPEELYRAVQAAVEDHPREHIRIPTSMSVVLDNAADGAVAGDYVTMLSSRGMYVRTPRTFPPKTIMPVVITLDDKKIAVKAKVIYSHKTGEGPFGEAGVGLYFTEITAADQERLQQYINHEVTKGIALQTGQGQREGRKEGA